MDYQNLLELVKNRRSIHRFKPEEIPDEYIDKIIEVARWAPSGFNSQPWEFVAVKRKDLRDSIVQFIGDYRTQSAKMEATGEPWRTTLRKPAPKFPMDYATAPVFILLFGDIRSIAGLPLAVKYDYDRCRITFISSLANAFLYMHLAATTLGLASQWVSAVRVPSVHCLVKHLLGIPNELEVYDMMAVGYPALKPRPKFVRTKEKLLHYDYCGVNSFRTGEEVRDFVKRTRTWAMATLRRAPDQPLG